MISVTDRPRLVDRIFARRHRIGAKRIVVLHDSENGRAMQIGEREWTVLSHADGTRDLEGIRLAAERAGARVRLQEIEDFFRELARLGLLADGPDAIDEVSLARDLPIVSMPDYRFHCDGGGGCCRFFGTIVFHPIEAARARVRARARR